MKLARRAERDAARCRHAPAVTTDSNTRRIALIVPTWSQSIYPWSFLKQYLLRVMMLMLPQGHRPLCLALLPAYIPVPMWETCRLCSALQRVETGGCTALDPSDKLFIVKVCKLDLDKYVRLHAVVAGFSTSHACAEQAGKADEEGERWKMGGPLVPDLDTALAHYPATVVRLEGSVRSSIRTFLERNSIDVLVVGEHWPSSGLQLTSGASSDSQSLLCPL